MGAGLFAWSLSRRVPVEEARRFFYEPLPVGELPPPARGEVLSEAELEQLYGQAEADFGTARYPEAAEGFASVVEGKPPVSKSDGST